MYILCVCAYVNVTYECVCAYVCIIIKLCVCMCVHVYVHIIFVLVVTGFVCCIMLADGEAWRRLFGICAGCCRQ